MGFQTAVVEAGASSSYARGNLACVVPAASSLGRFKGGSAVVVLHRGVSHVRARSRSTDLSFYKERSVHGTNFAKIAVKERLFILIVVLSVLG